MKLFTQSYARWRYQTLQVGNIVTKVLLYQIWCANEVCTGLNFIIKLFTTQYLNIFFTGVTRNGRILDKWLNL